MAGAEEAAVSAASKINASYLNNKKKASHYERLFLLKFLFITYLCIVFRWSILTVFIASFCVNTYAGNTLVGKFPNLASQTIILQGFNGFESYIINQSILSKEGEFTLNFDEKDYGMAFLQAENGKNFFVILSNENFYIEGVSLDDPKSIIFSESYENQKFKQYSTEHNNRIKTVTAWEYLQRIYEEDPMFNNRKRTRRNIQKEKLKIIREDNLFLKNIKKDSYVKWFLPIRKLVSDVPTIAQYQTYLIQETIEKFRNIDYSDQRLFKSGMLQNVLESHFWLIENSGKNLDSANIEMTVSIDRMFENLKGNEVLLNLIFDDVFDLLEQHSLFNASEYLALKLLNDDNCNISEDLTHQLETYRKMKIGNLAEDLVFKGDVTWTKFTGEKPKKLSDINSSYKLVVFGASWCPSCLEEIPNILRLYEKWRSYDLDVVYISLDTDSNTFLNFTKILPFASVCDYQKWESPMVKAYHVFATPTFFILDENHKVVLRPNGVKQIDAWVDWFLANKKK